MAKINWENARMRDIVRSRGGDSVIWRSAGQTDSSSAQIGTSFEMSPTLSNSRRMRVQQLSETRRILNSLKNTRQIRANGDLCNTYLLQIKWLRVALLIDYSENILDYRTFEKIEKLYRHIDVELLEKLVSVSRNLLQSGYEDNILQVEICNIHGTWGNGLSTLVSCGWADGAHPNYLTADRAKSVVEELSIDGDFGKSPNQDWISSKVRDMLLHAREGIK